MKAGDFVHYTPIRGAKENGRIKSMGDDFAFVVYKCDDNWRDFMLYTGARTDLNDLTPGWIDGNEPNIVDEE